MSEFSGTPGPWLIDRYGKVVDGRGMTVGVSGVALPMTRDAECVANANLVSAAPELLDALQEVWDSCCTNAASKPSKKALLMAHAAINKALGR